MLHLAYLGEAKKLKLNNNVLKFLAVRKPVSGIPEGYIHVPQLSPSLELFDKAQLWKKKIDNKDDIAYLKSIGKSEVDNEAWWFLYEREFKKELRERPDMVKAIKRLEERLKEGAEVYLFCYCKNVNRCHRGLVGEYMEEKGFKVDFRNDVMIQEPKKQKIMEQLTLFEIK